MTPRSPRFVSAQPDTPWFVWQCHVYIHNLSNLGVPTERLTALFAIDPGADPTSELASLKRRFPDVGIEVFVDERDERGRR